MKKKSPVKRVSKSKVYTTTKRKSPKRKSPKRKSPIKRKSKSLSKCRDLLSKKIGINIREFNNQKFFSRQQAIAAAYSQVKKMSPKCKKYF